MGIPNTFDGLVSAIVDLAEDDSLEFSSYIPTAIFLSEERLIKEVDSEGLIAITTVTASAGDPFITKPTGHRFTHDLTFRTSTKDFVQPSKKTNDFVKDYWPTGSTSTSTFPFGVPKYFGSDDNTTWILAPTPVSSYVFTVQYVKQLENVSANNQTNYFTDFCSDVLFYGTMVAIGEFMKDYEVTQVWEQRYQNALFGLNNQGRRQRRDDGSNPRNPEGGTNSLRGDV